MDNTITSEVEHPLDEAARLRGGRAALARELGVTPAAVGNWKVRGVPFEYCPKIWVLVPTVTRQRLRPNDWWEMWPELADAQTSAPAPLVGGSA